MVAGPKVELWVDGAWQDITSYVMSRDGSYNVGIVRGQPNEGGRTEASRCTLHLNNRDGRFSPRNPLSPLYGKIGRNQPLRVSVASGGGTAYRFLGEVPAWPQKWDVTGKDVWVEVDAAGVLRRLGQGNSPIGSAMYVAVAGGVSANQVIAYWACEDPASASVLSSAVSGVPAMAITGAPVLSTNTDFVCSGALPTMGTASFTGLVPMYIPDGGPIGSNPFVTMLRFLLEIPGGGATDGQIVGAFTWTGTIPRWEIYYAAAGGGQLGFRGRDGTGAVVQDTGVGGPALNGVKAHVTASLDESGGILLEFGLSILTVGSTSPSGPSSSALGPSSGIVQSITMAPGRGLSGTVIGHVSLQLSPAAPTDGSVLAQALVAFAGETAADRISRLCAVAGVTFELIGTAADTVAMGAQLSAALMDLIVQSVEADGGRLFESLSTVGLGYRTRVSLENQGAALALSYSGHNLAQAPVPLDDDQYTRNDIVVTRTGGASARATLTSGALSKQAPPDGVGPYPDAVTINIQADNTLADQAGWRLHLGTVDEARYPQLSINLAHPSIASSMTLGPNALALRPGDRITVSGLPPWLPPGPISQLLLGTSETIDKFQHRITFNCQPESPHRVAVTDDVVFGRADTDGSVLAANAGAADASISVITTAGAPLWVTTLANPAEFPFNVRAGGELMAVSACSSAITDTFTRTVSNGWGSADTGQAWTTTGGSAGDYAVTGSSGAHIANSVNVFRVTTAPMPQSDFDVRVAFATSAFPTGDSQWVYLIARYTDINNFYFARVQLSPTTGAVILNIRKRTTAGSDVQLSSYTTGLTFVAGAVYWVRLSGIGSALTAKVWQDPVPEPDWQTSATDTDITVVGGAGVRTFLGSSSTNTLPVTFTFDNFEFLNVQTMQVTRSVNGVVKPQPLGTDVRLDQPAIAAL